MNRFLYRLKIFFLAVFAVSCVVVVIYHSFWVWPSQRCESKGNWWDGSTRTCAVPVPLYMITGRPNKPFVPEDPNAPENAPPKAAAAPAAEPTPATPPKK
ncbi:hypothetical protein [Caulobacter sp. NIBR2454]|uniref:hypothetical protein n=1 Tax=Caulobacter sp. NIBR2454 TaxID=3015996 RepID=UPI0022B669FD|nr:hypothetical protein [Caulobacter sp. NIBR2454]